MFAIIFLVITGIFSVAAAEMATGGSFYYAWAFVVCALLSLTTAFIGYLSGAKFPGMK